jgi:hypothetical protein
MEIEFHPEAWPQLHNQHATDITTVPLLDWQGLRARLIAAHALRREVSSITSAITAASASFDRAVACELLVLCDSLHHVNPSASANGKSLGGIEANIGGAITPGERGCP